MNREIKFRAWNKDWGAMIYSDSGFSHYKRELYAVGFSFGYAEYPHREDNTILMQYIGLSDRKGLEIYEGDILEIYLTGMTSETVTPTFGVVAWSNEDDYQPAAMFVIKTRYGDWSFENNEITMIGNIHENPELLEKIGSEA